MEPGVDQSLRLNAVCSRGREVALTKIRMPNDERNPNSRIPFSEPGAVTFHLAFVSILFCHSSFGLRHYPEPTPKMRLEETSALTPALSPEEREGEAATMAKLGVWVAFAALLGLCGSEQ